MQILPIDPAFQRVILQGNLSPEGLQLTLGQKIAATVLKINEEGQLLLGFGTQKVWARSELPFVEGQQLQLRVNQNGPTVELQLLHTAAEGSVEKYELASLLQARNEETTLLLGEPDPIRLLNALQNVSKSDSSLLTEPQSRQLKALLEPIIASNDARALLPQIKNLIENSGVFFEAKLRTVLQALNASPEAALQKVGSDLKLLLGQLQQRPSTEEVPASSTEAPPMVERNALPGSPISRPSDLELARASGPATNVVRPDSPPTAVLRASGPAERPAGLQTLLDLMKSSPDQRLQKLAADLVALLQTGRADQIPTQPSANRPERLLNTGSLTSTTKAPGLESVTLERRLPIQSGETDQTKHASPSSPTDPQPLEHKVRELLDVVRSASEPAVRKLLPEVMALLTSEKDQYTPSEKGLDPSRSTVLEQSAALSDRVLSRQTEAAFEWLKNGALQAELPMQFGAHSTQAKIRFLQDTNANTQGSSRRPLNINIYLDLPDTGKLEAWARWEGSQIQATLYVRDAETRELFEPQLKELSTSLRQAGFTTTVLDVRIDPGRLYKIQDDTDETWPQEGSLLSLRV